MARRSAAFSFLLPLVCAASLSAQGLYVGPEPGPRPDPGPVPVPRPHPPRPHRPLIHVPSLAVTAKVQDGIASTRLRQVFRNDGGRIGEGTWILPLPAGATADRFTMTVNGVETAGEVLDAGRARQIYENIVRQQRDPGLLEYLGRGCLKARVFPIPAHGEVVVEVRYRQVLPETAGLHRFTFPARAAGLGGCVPQQFSLDVQITSRKAIKNVYSPLAGVDVVQQGDHHARASFEAKGQLPTRDVDVFYGLSDAEFGLNLVTYRRPGEPGYFMMLLAPKQEWPLPEHTAKAITFVLDTSGSMQGAKIAQARSALTFFLQSLHARDRFNVVPFSTEARPFFQGLVPADDEHRAQALAKVAAIEARGGTNIQDALQRTLQQDLPAEAGMTYVPITVFLTDGLPTVGTTDTKQLLAQVATANQHKARVFVFGVGHDVNTQLLDTVAQQTRGDRDYVREGESIEVKTGALFTKLSHPVMTSVELLCDGIDGFDVLPNTTPDLFKGSRLQLFGRYRGEGQHAVRLKGVVNGQAKEFVFEGAFAASDTEHDFVPALWAQRKVARLLDAIRLNGRQQELVDEVTRLGKEFGIVTPYTSHLVVEEGMRIARARGLRPVLTNALPRALQERLGRELRRAGALPAPASPAAGRAEGEEVAAAVREAKKEAEKARGRLADLGGEASGERAVDDSVRLRTLGFARVPADGSGAARLLQRRIGARTFYLAAGVWIDARYVKSMTATLRKVAAYSDDYFALVRKHPDVAPCLAFSSRILLVVNGQAIEIEERT